MIAPYERKTNYYETDQMGIIHHSNYIRYFEEARLYYLEQYGLPYEEIEKLGILIPVLSVQVDYKKAIRYGDTIEIKEWMMDFSPVKFSIKYEVRNKETGELHATGTSGHCFVDKELRPVRLKRDYREIYDKLVVVAERDKKELDKE